MADLMTDAYEYESLRKKYKSFTTPAVKFKIGGTDVVQKKEIQVLSVEVTLSLNSAGSARIVLGGCYDYKNGAFDKSVRDLAVLGKEVEEKKERNVLVWVLAIIGAVAAVAAVAYAVYRFFFAQDYLEDFEDDFEDEADDVEEDDDDFFEDEGEN